MSRALRRQNVALNQILPLPQEGEVAGWLPLLPAGEKLTGRDGREFLNPSPGAVLTNQRQRNLDVPIDVEHATEIKGPAGEEAPAYGWFTDFKVEGGTLYGKAEWNDAGNAVVDVMNEANGASNPNYKAVEFLVSSWL